MQEEITLISKDGLKLYGVIDAPQAPKAMVVIVHGLAEHLNRYDVLTQFLTQRGFAVVRYDQRGHARSEAKEGKRVFLRDFNELPDDVSVAVEYAKNRFSKLPVYVLGHSMGGFSVVAFATKYPTMADGIITSGAWTRGNNRELGDIPADMPYDTYFPNALGGKVCTDTSVIDAYQKDPLVEKAISASIFYEVAKGIYYLKANAERFCAPVLILHGSEDGLVSEKDSRDLFGEIGSEDKELIIYAKLYHEILNEPIKERIYATLCQWIDDRLPV